MCVEFSQRQCGHNVLIAYDGTTAGSGGHFSFYKITDGILM